MTREEIVAMVPGAELDAAVAINVMGWSDLWTDGKVYMAYPLCEQKYSIGEAERHPVWPFSTDIAAAWEVWEKLIEWLTPHEISISRKEHVRGITTYQILIFGRSKKYPDRCWNGLTDVMGKTAPEAICKAALLAIMGNID